MADNNDSFSFDNDPGKLTDKDDQDFNFSDIPILGDDKNKKESFSFDELPDNEDESIASFEALLKDSPESSEDGEYDDETRTEIEIERATLERKARKKKRLMINLAIAGVAVFVLCLIIGMVLFFMDQAAKRAAEEAKKLTPAEKRALEIKRQQEKIQNMIKDANSKLASGSFAEAEPKYREILKIDKTNPGALTGLGMCFKAQGNIPQAEKTFREAIENQKADGKPYSGLAEIMFNRKQYSEVIELLENVVDKFPDEKNILIPLADSYNLTQDNLKALETYKKISKSDLQKTSLLAFAKLMTLESKKDAKQLYLYTANKFKDFDCYMKAAKLAEEKDDKIQILTDAVAALKEDPKASNNAKFALAEAILEFEDAGKTAEILGQIQVENLKPEYSKRLLGLANKAGIEDLKPLCTSLLKARPNDFELQKTVQRQLLVTEGPATVLELYSEWKNQNSESPIANYLYAKSLGYSTDAKKYYRKALELDPKFFQASMELGKIAMDEKNWQEAEKAFAYCAENMQDDKNSKYLFALVRIKNGKGKKALAEYSKFLDSKDLTDGQKAAELVSLALLLPDSKVADKYINILGADPAFKEEYKMNKAKKHLLFNLKAPDSIFKGARKGDFRQYKMLNMLANGKEAAVLKMPTPREEFPEFWKVFLSRRKNYSTWKNLAEKLYEKNKNSEDPTIKIITGLWLDKIKLADAEKMFNRIPFDKEALFYFILAEEYRRNKRYPKAKIRYRKAQSCGPNVYSGVINHYSIK